MVRRIFFTTLIGLTFGFHLPAQEVWSLEKCIEYARQNALSIKRAQYTAEQSELTLKQNQFSRLPNLNANISGFQQYGLNVNPTTNTLQSQESFAGNSSLSSSVVVFDGFRISNSIKQGKANVRAAKLEAQAQINDISLQVAQAYLSILLAQEQLENARQRVALSKEQLEQTEKQIEAGTLPVNQRLDFVAQVAADEQAVVEAQNQVEINYLNLKQLMEVDPSLNFVIERPEVVIPEDVDPVLYQSSDVYSTALQTQPQVEAGNYRLDGAQLQEEIARSGFFPTLTFFGQLDTRFTNRAKDFTDPQNVRVVESDPVPVKINGEEAQLAFFEQRQSFPDQPLLNQLNDNFGQSFGFQLSIPLYSRHQTRIAVQRAQLDVLNQEVANRQIRQQLKTDVQRAVADAKAAKRSMEAARRSQEAAEAAFDNAQKRYNLGAINSLEYTTARNTLDRAQTELTRARFQYIFNLKVIDFYLGRALRLE